MTTAGVDRSPDVGYRKFLDDTWGDVAPREAAPDEVERAAKKLREETERDRQKWIHAGPVKPDAIYRTGPTGKEHDAGYVPVVKRGGTIVQMVPVRMSLRRAMAVATEMAESINGGGR